MLWTIMAERPAMSEDHYQDCVMTCLLIHPHHQHLNRPRHHLVNWNSIPGKKKILHFFCFCLKLFWFSKLNDYHFLQTGWEKATRKRSTEPRQRNWMAIRGIIQSLRLAVTNQWSSTTHQHLPGVIQELRSPWLIDLLRRLPLIMSPIK